MHASLKRSFYPLPDAVLGLYLLCIGREYLWVLGGSYLKNVAAWTLSAVCAGTLIWLWSAKRGAGWEGTESTLGDDWHARPLVANQRQTHTRIDWLWVLIVVAPPLIFFFLRAPFPSLDFDNLNYHLVNTERALRGWPLIAGDFFPGTLLVNPAPDMTFGVLRAIVGHRLAPVLNVAALIWTAQVLNEIIAPFVPRESRRYPALLLILATEHVMFLVNLYMVDLLALPLLLSALLLTLRFRETADKGRSLVKIALFFGLSLAFKLTNVCFVLPIALLLLVELWRVFRDEKRRPSVANAVLAAIAVVLPGLYFYIYMYRETGNPLFPYYNQIFKSALSLPIAYVDHVHGPANIFQKVFWPIVSFIYPERLSAMGSAAYSGRLNLGFILACAFLFSRSTPRVLRKINFVTVLATLLWSFTSGDIRYALFSETLCGIACLGALLYVWQMVQQLDVTRSEKIKRYAAAGLFTFFVSLCSLSGLWFGLIHFECSSETKFCDRPMQPYFMTRLALPTYRYIYHAPLSDTLRLAPANTYFREASYFLRDQSDDRFFDESARRMFRDVDVWVNCVDSTSGVMALAGPQKPMISVARFLYLFDYMKATGAQQRVRETLAQQQGKRFYTLILQSDLATVEQDLARAPLGLHLSPQMRRVSVPLYSPYTRMNLLFIEILPEQTNELTATK
jgi:hypothetical protein